MSHKFKTKEIAMKLDRKKHWETVYETKSPDQVSWTQESPKTSLEFIHSFGLNKSAKIIDIGGGDSKLVDYLLDEGFENVTVLDISAKSLEQISKYIKTARKSVNGFLTIGTFSKNGPEKCSGLEIKQYNEDELTLKLKNGFDKIKCVTEDHLTPFDTTQNFLFCSFKRQLN